MLSSCSGILFIFAAHSHLFSSRSSWKVTASAALHSCRSSSPAPTLSTLLLQHLFHCILTICVDLSPLYAWALPTPNHQHTKCEQATEWLAQDLDFYPASSLSGLPISLCMRNGEMEEKSSACLIKCSLQVEKIPLQHYRKFILWFFNSSSAFKQSTGWDS